MSCLIYHLNVWFDWFQNAIRIRSPMSWRSPVPVLNELKHNSWREPFFLAAANMNEACLYDTHVIINSAISWSWGSELWVLIKTLMWNQQLHVTVHCTFFSNVYVPSSSFVYAFGFYTKLVVWLQSPKKSKSRVSLAYYGPEKKFNHSFESNRLISTSI